MGGHASGEVASRIAVEELAEFFRLTGRDEEATWPFAGEPGRRLDENRLLTGIRLANLRILERAGTDERLRGMGTTLVCAHFDKGAESVIIGHVGDSRAYLLRQGAIRQLTEDHSLLNDYLRTRQLTPEEIEHFPHKNVIVRALGMKDQVEVDLQARAAAARRRGPALLRRPVGHGARRADRRDRPAAPARPQVGRRRPWWRRPTRPAAWTTSPACWPSCTTERRARSGPWARWAGTTTCAGQPVGPVGQAALLELIRSGRLAPGTRVWRPGLASWAAWETVLEPDAWPPLAGRRRWRGQGPPARQQLDADVLPAGATPTRRPRSAAGSSRPSSISWSPPSRPGCWWSPRSPPSSATPPASAWSSACSRSPR